MITIEQGESSPYVFVDTLENKMILNGNSFVSNPNVFYEELINWGKTVKAQEGKSILVEIKIGYYSTSNIQLFNLFFKTLHANNPDRVEVVFFLEKEEEEDLDETILSLVFNTGITHKIKHL
jgi:hypothetical protein